MTTPAQPRPEEWVDAYGKRMKLNLTAREFFTVLGVMLWQKVTRAEARRGRTT